MNIQSTWQEVSAISAPTLEGSTQTEVIIIGGGIAGITTAYLLAKAGKKVVVVEKGNTHDSSVTAYTTAFLTHSLDTDLVDLKKIFGTRDTKKILQSHEDAIDLVEKIIKDEHIECGFVKAPHYSIALSQSGAEDFKKEKDLSNQLGFTATWKESSFFPFQNYGAMVLDKQAMFHPLKYINGVRAAFEKMGGTYFDNTEAKAIEGDIRATVTTNHGTVTGNAVVIATYNTFIQPWWYIFKKGMYKSYVYELTIPKGSIPDGMYEDEENPYHYFRVEGERMIVGGEDHRIEIKFDPENAYSRLRKYVEEKLGIVDYKIVHKWSGPILEQVDGIPLIGLYSGSYKNRYVETAFSGNGMTNGTIAAMVVSDLILGKKNTYAQLYSPSRRIRLMAILVKSRDYIQEFFNAPFDKKN